jgi:hypothetical protein
LIQYDQAGLDVSCAFTKPDSGLVTLYLTRQSAELFEQSFQGAVQAIQSSTGGTPRKGGEFQLPAGIAWRQAGFTLRDGQIHSDLIVAHVSGWELKVRASYNPDQREPVSQTVLAIVESALNTAGRHLASCAAAPSPNRSGKVLDGKPLLLGLIMSGMVVAEKDLPGNAASARWCAEASLAINDQPYVYWRDIAALENGPVDRITAIRTDEAIFIVKDQRGKALATELAPSEAGEPDIYDLFIDRQDKLALKAIYRGRPSLEDIAQTLSKDGRVLAEISKKDKATTIYYQP